MNWRKSIVALLLCFALVLPTALAEVAKGAKGDEVKAIQQMLADLGYLTGKVDGDFGGGTEKAVKAFQAAEGMEETGVVDDATLGALKEKSEALAEEQAAGEADKIATALQNEYDREAEMFRSDPSVLEVQVFKAQDGMELMALTISTQFDKVVTSLLVCPPADWAAFYEGTGLQYIMANLNAVTWTGTNDLKTYDYIMKLKYVSQRDPGFSTKYTHMDEVKITDSVALNSLWIDLPTNPYIAGNQALAVTNMAGDKAAIMNITLEKRGEGQGWSVNLVDSRQVQPGELGALMSEAAGVNYFKLLSEFSGLTGGHPIPRSFKVSDSREGAVEIQGMVEIWEPDEAAIRSLLAGETWSFDSMGVDWTRSYIHYTAEDDTEPGESRERNAYMSLETNGDQIAIKLEDSQLEGDLGVWYDIVLESDTGYRVCQEYRYTDGELRARVWAQYKTTYYDQLPDGFHHAVYKMTYASENNGNGMDSVSLNAYETESESSSHVSWYGDYSKGEMWVWGYSCYDENGEEVASDRRQVAYDSRDVG